MEFWGVEVKSGEPLKVQPEPGKLIHISQAALGEVKDVKGAKYVPLRLKIDAKTSILGSLSAEERTQMMLDLVFEREFELSHDWKNGSVYVLGYIADDAASDDSEDEQVHAALQYGNMKQNLVDVKPVTDEDEDDSESDSDDSEEDSEDDTDESFSSEEEPPKEEQETKKRPADSAREAPVFNKKAKTSTPKNTGNKKNANNSIPLPSKNVGKGPASNKSNEKNKKANGRLSRK